jgi:hypothetical protein
LTFSASRIIYIGARFSGHNGDIFPLNGGKNTWTVSLETSAIFTVICATVFLYMGDQRWKAREGIKNLSGILKEQAMDNIRPKERALCLPGAGFLLGLALFLSAI